MKIIDEKGGVEDPKKDISGLSKSQRKAFEKEVRRSSYPNWVDILAIVGMLIVAQLLAGLIVLLLGAVTKWSTGLINAIGIFLQLTFAILFIVLQRRSRKAPANVINLREGRLSGPLILWGVILMMATSIVVEPILNLFPDKYLELLNESIGLGGWAILSVVVIAPILEETLFRGLIQGSINERDGATKAILLSALIFGVIHIIPQQVVNAFFMGIILGYIYFRTRSLITVIILHALNNAIAYLQMELLGGESVKMTTKALIGNDVFYYVVYAISAVLLIIGAVMIIRNLKERDQEREMLMETDIKDEKESNNTELKNV